jgi:DNA-binding Lrp family transcriptional regulator
MNAHTLDYPHQFCIKGKAEAIVLITTAYGSEKNVLKELRQLDALTEAYNVHGSYDILARFKTDNYDHLSELLNIKINKIKGVRRTRNLIIT